VICTLFIHGHIFTFKHLCLHSITKILRNGPKAHFPFSCAQLLWMRQTLRDYSYKLTKVPLLCDNESAIRMADNPVEHSRTKHIAIRYHFLRDHQQKGDIEISYINTKDQLADIFTKPLDEQTFNKLRHELNILDSRNFFC
jgi:hypothetical protein